MCHCICRDSTGEAGSAKHNKKSARLVSSAPAASELNEDILSSLGQLLTSSAGASSLGELLKMIPSVSRLSRSMTTTSDSRAVKRRRVSASTHDNLLARSGDGSPAAHSMKHVNDHQPVLSPSCFTGLFAHHHVLISHSISCVCCCRRSVK